MFTQDVLTQALAPRAVRYLPQTGSTNDDALAWLNGGAADGAVVIAGEQVRGRGRMGRAWHAPPGTALLLSIVLRPHLQHLPRLTMLGALAVCELAEAYGIAAVDIKWPNDVRIGGRKLSGVLPEAAWAGDRLLGAVLGIGLNLSVDFTGTPFAHTAISLATALRSPEVSASSAQDSSSKVLPAEVPSPSTEREFRDEVGEVSALSPLAVLTRLLTLYDRWRAQLGQPALYQAWRQRLALGGHIRVTAPEGVLEGVAEGVTPDGALLLRMADGTLRHILAGDVFEV